MEKNNNTPIYDANIESEVSVSRYDKISHRDGCYIANYSVSIADGGKCGRTVMKLYFNNKESAESSIEKLHNGVVKDIFLKSFRTGVRMTKDEFKRIREIAGAL